MICAECEKIKAKKNLIYEDSKVIALLNDKPSTGGHVLLYPKEHYVIIEQIPDETFEHMFSVANKISVALFDAIGAHGTNILINNGIAAGQKTTHALINIIPRVENDGLNFQWNSIKENEESLKTVQLTLQQEEKEEIKEVKEEPKVEEAIEEDEENYMLRQLERMP